MTDWCKNGITSKILLNYLTLGCESQYRNKKDIVISIYIFFIRKKAKSKLFTCAFIYTIMLLD